MGGNIKMNMLKRFWYKEVMDYEECKLCGKLTYCLLFGDYCSEECEREFMKMLTLEKYIDYQNEKRINIHYPYRLEIAKEKCPKCKGEMIHDTFQKAIDIKKGYLLAMYQCTSTNCDYRNFFNLTKNKWEKRKS